MRLLYFGDMHEDENVPVSRIDDFTESKIRKIEEIIYLGIKYKISGFLQGGDFLSSPKFSHELLSKVIKRWSQVDVQELVLKLSLGKIKPEEVAKKLEECIPIIGVVGNHEMFGSSMSNFNKTSLNFLKDIGFINLASKENPIIFEQDGIKVAITGGNYSNDMDKTKAPYIVEEKKGDYHIHLVHGMLSNKSMGKIKHTTIDEIVNLTQADLTIAGHNHLGFETVEKDGKVFTNPGSPVRLTNNVKEMDRMPKVLLIEITKENGIKIIPIKLKSAKKGIEVLSREKIEEAKEKECKFQEIVSTVNKTELGKGTNIIEIIDVIANNKGISQGMKDEIVSAVTEKMAEMQLDTTKKGEEYYITKLVLENFMSHKYSEFNFTNGLNILGGESRSGKSAVLKALGLIYENEARNPRRWIYGEENYLKVTIYLSTGYIISRIVERKQSGKNGYEIYDPHTGENSYNNTKALPLVQEILGFHKINIDTKDKVNINFSRQGDSWFFIGKSKTGTERAKLIGVIYGTHYSDAVIKDYEASLKNINKEKNKKIEERKDKQKKYDKYGYLEEMKKDIEILESMKAELMELINKRDKAEVLLHERNRIVQQAVELNKVIETLSTNEVEINNTLVELKEEIKRSDKVKDLIEHKKSVTRKGIEATKVLTALKDLNKANDLLNEIKELNINKKNIEESYNKSISLINIADTIKRNIAINDEIIKATENINDAKILIEELKKLREQNNKAELLLTERKKIVTEGIKYKASIKGAINKNKELVEKYKNLLIDKGDCPMCHGTIDNATINRIVEHYSMKE